MSLERYAQIIDVAAHSATDWDQTLASLGVTEAEWDAADEYWQARLDDEEDGPEISELMGRFAGSLQQLQQTHCEHSLDFETWLAVARSIRRGASLPDVLKERGLTLGEFLSAQSAFAAELGRDPERMARYEEVVLGPRT